MTHKNFLYKSLLKAKNNLIDYNEGISGYFGPITAKFLNIKPGWYKNGKFLKELKCQKLL